MSRCAMVFGWAGSPGEYVSFARAAKWAHGRRRPPLPRVNGTARFARMWPMDDGIILERRVGLRPWLAAEERDAATRQAWGPEAVNVELGEEGASREEQLVRGLHLDASARRIWLPEPKCAKAADLSALPELRCWQRRVPLQLERGLRGSAKFWASAQPTIGAELTALDRQLAGGSKSPRAAPLGAADEVAPAWDEWGSTLEMFRVLLDVPETRSTTFESGFRRALAPRGRLALPGVSQRTRWTGGDATTDIIGCIDWGLALRGETARAPIYTATEAAPRLRRREDVLAQPGAEADWVIALIELLAFVALAAARGESRRGELVCCVTRNMNVKSWLAKRRPKRPLARHVTR